MKTLFVLEQTRPPFDSANVLAVNLPLMSYGKTPQQVDAFYREVQRRVSLPGVEHVSSGFGTPWRDDRGLSISFRCRARHQTCGRSGFWARFRVISPGFFDTFGVPLRRSRL